MEELDPYKLNIKRNTVHRHALRGKIRPIKKWLSNGGFINERDHQGQTLLHAATHGRQKHMVRFLIENGSDVNISSDENPYHTYAIQTAVYYGQMEIVKALINVGADISVCTENGCSLLHLAAFNDHTEVATFLLKLGLAVDTLAKSKQTPLRASAMHSLFEISSVFLQAGANANAIDHIGFTPIFEVHDIELVKLLIKYGANINHKNNFGQTPIFYAGIPEIIDILILHGADVDIVDNNGETLLHFISHYTCETETIKMILPFFPDINIRDHKGHTPLWHAHDWRKRENEKFLRSLGGIL